MANDLSETQYALIGRAVRSFSALEHEIGRAIIGLMGGLDRVTADLELEAKTEEMLSKSFAGRIDEFLKLCAQDANITSEWVHEFRQNVLEDGRGMRNAFVHGIWQRADGDVLELTFYSQDCFKKGQQPKTWRLTVRDMQEIDSSNLKNIKLLTQHFAPL